MWQPHFNHSATRPSKSAAPAESSGRKRPKGALRQVVSWLPMLVKSFADPGQLCRQRVVRSLAVRTMDQASAGCGPHRRIRRPADRSPTDSRICPLVVFHRMSNVEQIEVLVSQLSRQELARFRAWYSKFDADAWDHQIEHDAASGKLNQLAQRALQAHASGSTRAL